jgi:tetratricopeptide (TPR) repeat protein
MSTSENPLVPRSEGELLRKSYTDDEVTLIYELARLSFESGNQRRAEALARGLVAVAPDFIPSYILLATVLAFSKAYEQATDMVQAALRLNENCVEAYLLGSSVYLSQANFTMAGTMLGEAEERIKQAPDISPALKSFYSVQLARFESAKV